MNRLLRIKAEILAGRNIFIYITILLCIAAAVGSLLASHFANGVLMMVLGLLLGHILEERWSRNDFESRMNQHTTWDDLRQGFLDRLGHAKTVSFLAVSPLDILRTYEKELRRIIDYKGGRVQFLVVDPYESAMQLIAVGRPENKTDGEIFLNEIAKLKSFLQVAGDGLNKSSREQATESLADPQVEVRVLCTKYNYVPSCILTLIDDEENDGAIFVTVYSYKQSDPARPSLRLTRADGVWYTFFQREFKDLWGPG